MTTITLSKFGNWIYDSKKKEFKISASYVKFDTSYKLINPKTLNSKIFSFKNSIRNSTGSVYAQAAAFTYESEDGLSLRIENDSVITAERKQSYSQTQTYN